MLACGPLIVPMVFIVFVGSNELADNMAVGVLLIATPAVIGLLMAALVLTVRGGKLHHCARTAQTEHIATLVSLGADVNRQTALGATALHYAAARGDRHSVKVLIDSGADPSLQDRQGRTPCDWAQARGQVEVVELLRSAYGSE